MNWNLPVKQKPNSAEDVSTSRLSVHARLGLPVDVKKVKKNKRTVREEVSPETKSKTTSTHRRATVISTKEVISGTISLQY